MKIRLKDPGWFLVIFGVAFLLRLAYLFQIESVPLFYHLAGDARTYDEWAQRIAAGDWLGQGVFYQAPLYPYFLGALQLVLGHNLWQIRLLQIALGALSCALIFLVGQRLFSRPAGIAAGLLLSCYAPAIFFEGLIEKTILDLFFMSVLLALLFRSAEVEPHGQSPWHLIPLPFGRNPEPGPTAQGLPAPRQAGRGPSRRVKRGRQCVAAGAVLGLFALSRENVLILALVVPLCIAFHFHAEPAANRLRWIALFFSGLLLILLPVGLRNLAVGGEFRLTTAQFGPNFFIGNNPSADGTYESIRKAIGEPQLEGEDAKRLAENALGRALTPGEVSGYWAGRAWKYIAGQTGEWFTLLGKKWLMVWNAREVEDSDDFYIYQQWSGLLWLFGWINHFGILAPLAVVGAWLTRRRWRELWLLYAMTLALAFSVSLFYVFGRYRFSLVPLLALFAGAGIVGFLSLCRQRAGRPLVTATIVLVAAGVFVNWPIYGISGPGAGGYNNLSNAFFKQGKVKEAVQAALRAIELRPDYGVAHFNLGNLYSNQGELDLAQRHFEKAIGIYPNYAPARNNLGQLLVERGDLASGIELFRRAIELDPKLPGPHFNLGLALAKQDRVVEAVSLFEEAVRLDSESTEAHFYLATVYAALGRYEEAAKYFSEALRLKSDFAEAHESLARVFSAQGKKELAIRHYQEAIRLLRLQGGAPGSR
jgi:tetratricopeptide (TPR) repeat protein